jgi:hypothetical protein
MISADDALRIADSAARRNQWGSVDGRFRATAGKREDVATWDVRRKTPVIGADCWFRIDAESGEILEAGARGSR